MKKILAVLAVPVLALTSCQVSTSTKPSATKTIDTSTNASSPKESTTKPQTNPKTNPKTTTPTVEEKYFTYPDNPSEKKSLSTIKKDFNPVEHDYKRFYSFDSSSFQYTMDMPSTSVSSVAELSALLDYCVFYHIDKVDVDFTKYTGTNNTFELMNQAFWDSDLLPGTVGLNEMTTTSKSCTIEILYNEEANSYSPKEYSVSNTILPLDVMGSEKRASDNTTFPYMNTKKESLTVYNSDQLLYALTHNYMPDILSDSPAMRLYEKASSILNTIITNDMTEEEKIASIHAYVLSTCTYDYTSDEVIVAQRIKQFPDELTAMTTAVYAEGVFDQHTAVCHGFAKALAILCSMEGIEIRKVSTADNDVDWINTTSSVVKSGEFYTYSSHGYCYIKNKTTGKYYVSDITYNFAGSSKYSLYRLPAVLLDYQTWSMVYSFCRMDHFAREMKNELATKAISYAEIIKVSNGSSEYDLYIENKEDLLNTLTAIKSILESKKNSIPLNAEYYYIPLSISSSYQNQFISQDRNLIYDYFSISYMINTSSSITLEYILGSSFIVSISTI